MSAPQFDDAFDEYNYYHAICPKCSGSDFDETCMAFQDPKLNPNKHICKSCGWEGYQHQLLPEIKKIHE